MLSALQNHPRIIANYDLLEQIATGGMGTVYRGKDRTTGDTVAIKVVPFDGEADPKLLLRFQREFALARGLDHPNIVRVLRFGQDGTSAFLAMEFIAGESLGQRIGRVGALTENQVVRTMAQVAQGLHAAHQVGIIHRDVKPDNILIRPDGLVKIIDLGLAKDIDSNLGLTRCQSGLGTPHFMAPEQFTGAEFAGVPCDIYSLAATAYMAATARLPFGPAGLASMVMKKTKGELTPPRKLVPALSESFDRAVLRAMDPTPERRPTTCLEFMAELVGRVPVPSLRDAPTNGRTKKEPACQKAQGAERRASVRLAYELGTVCSIETSLFPDADCKESWPAVIHDISAGGVGLLLARRFEAGAMLDVAFSTQDPATSKSLPVRVARVVPSLLGHWFVGCSFLEELGSAELAALVR